MSSQDPEEQRALMAETVRAVFPWCMTHNHATRAFAQLTIDACITHIQDSPTMQSLLENSDFQQDVGVHTWPNVSKYLMQNKELVRLKKKLGASIMQLHAHDHQEPWPAPQHVFAIPDSRSKEDMGFEASPEALTERIQVFLAEERIKVREANDAAVYEKEIGSHQSTRSLSDPSRDDPHPPVQRKIMTVEQRTRIHGGDVPLSWGLSMDVVSDAQHPMFDQEDLLRSWTSSALQRASIIVVASLIDKIPNLAGLARSCEVFRAESLVLSDRSVIKNQSFASISVTAEDWIQIEEVKPVALVPWLEAKKAFGYHVIGIEQTSTSQSLMTYPFPQKCVMVLGREKEGIPADVLQVIDTTIEIPQLGVIRSLNVHVTGALTLYEYTRQHMKT